MDTQTKRCSKCGEEKPSTLEFFAADRRKATGLRSDCKECQHAYRASTRDHTKQYNQEYWKKWYRENRERRQQQMQAYYIANREWFAEYQRKYRAAKKKKA